MNNNIGFFTPVRYEGQKTFIQWVHEKIENYFYFGGKCAYVIPGKTINNSQAVRITDPTPKKGSDQNKREKVLEIARKISYLILLIPLGVLLAKAVFRATHKFHVASPAPIVTPPLSSPEEPQPLENKGVSNSPAFTESSSSLNFYSHADQFSFWDHYFQSYRDVINHDNWDNINGLRFLHDEIQGVNRSLGVLLNTIKTLKQQLQLKKASDSQEKPNSIEDLEKSVNALVNETKQSLDTLQKKIQEKQGSITSQAGQNPSSITPVDVKGFRNAGNTCYINSALQPLLAIRNFEELVPKEVPSEPEYTRKQRQAVLESFRSFLQAWKDKKSPTELGSKIGQLRRQIFEAGLLEGGFVDPSQERNFQDAGQFFELILHVLGRGFQLEMIKTPMMNDGTVISLRQRVEKTSQGVFYLQLPGDSLQEIVEKHRNALNQELTSGNEWRIEYPDKGEILLSQFKEMQKIVGPTPEILVVRVNPRIVNPEQDQNINFAALFKHPPENAEYELVGFSQNHYQVHWTSVVYDGETWKLCDDHDVQPISPADGQFRCPANYMVYKKKSSSNS